MEIGTENQSDASIFFDDFNRADTANNVIGNAPSGQAWTITGLGAADVRITSRSLARLETTGAYYAWPTLAYTPNRLGCMVRYRTGSGAGSYVSAMGMTAGTRDLNSPMIHFTFSDTLLGVEMWNGGDALGNIQRITYTQPMQNNVPYCIEWEVDAATDTVTIYSPDGQVLVYTDPLVSDAVSPNVFYEFACTPPAAKMMDFLAVWATATTSSRASIEGRIGAWRGRSGPMVQNSTLAVLPDQNGQFVLGRVKLSGIIGDTATFGHFDHSSTIYKNALTQDSVGQTLLGSNGASSPVYVRPNAVDAFVFHTNRFSLRHNATLGIEFEGSSDDANETSLIVENPTGDRTYRFADAPTTSTLTVAAVLTKTDAGDPASGYEGQIVINTADNTAKIYADGGWRTIASGW